MWVQWSGDHRGTRVTFVTLWPCVHFCNVRSTKRVRALANIAHHLSSRDGNKIRSWMRKVATLGTHRVDSESKKRVSLSLYNVKKKKKKKKKRNSDSKTIHDETRLWRKCRHISISASDVIILTGDCAVLQGYYEWCRLVYESYESFLITYSTSHNSPGILTKWHLNLYLILKYKANHICI